MSYNDVTGDKIQSKSNSKKFRDNWDQIFGNKKKLDKEQLNKKEENKNDSN